MSVTDSVEDRLIGAFDVATRGVHPDEFEIERAEPAERETGLIGRVALPANTSVTLNDRNADTLDGALSLYGWQVGTIRATEDGMVVSVWEVSASR